MKEDILTDEALRIKNNWRTRLNSQITEQADEVQTGLDQYIDGVASALTDVPETGRGQIEGAIVQFLRWLVSSPDDQVILQGFRNHFQDLYKLLEGLALTGERHHLGHRALKDECTQISRIIRRMMKCSLAGIAYKQLCQDSGWRCIDISSDDKVTGDPNLDWLSEETQNYKLILESNELDAYIGRNDITNRIPQILNIGKEGKPVELKGEREAVQFEIGSIAVQALSEFEWISIFALGQPQKTETDFGQPTHGDDLLLQIAALFVRSRFRQFGPASIYALTHLVDSPAAFISGNLRAFKSEGRHDLKALEIAQLLSRYHSEVRFAIAQQGGHVLHAIGDNFIAAVPGGTELEAYQRALDAARELRQRWLSYDPPSHQRPNLTIGISGNAAQVLCINDGAGHLLAAIGQGISNARLLQRCADANECAILVDSSFYDVLKAGSGSVEDVQLNVGWDQLWANIQSACIEESSLWPEPWRRSLTRVYSLEEGSNE